MSRLAVILFVSASRPIKSPHHENSFHAKVASCRSLCRHLSFALLPLVQPARIVSYICIFPSLLYISYTSFAAPLGDAAFSLLLSRTDAKLSTNQGLCTYHGLYRCFTSIHPLPASFATFIQNCNFSAVSSTRILLFIFP